MSPEPNQAEMTPSNPNSPYPEDHFERIKGNCNVLLIAPHGHPEDDTNTGKLTRELADRLGCYAVINEKYQKWSNAGLTKPDPENYAVDLYNWTEANKFKKTRVFIDTIEQFKGEILRAGNPALLIHIHGIKNKNMLLVAEKLNEYKDKQDSLHAVIGYGQRKGDNSRFTASKTDLVTPLINAFGELDFNVAIAPVDPIIVKKEKKRLKKWYCGNHSGRLNQKLSKPVKRVQSLQIEFRKNDVREFESEIIKTADILDAALKPFVKPILDSADQKDTIQRIKAGDIDLKNNQFKARIDEIDSDSVEFTRLVESVKIDGVLNNVIVKKRNGKNEKPYQLISGFRRITALKAALYENGDFANATVPARILDTAVSDDDAYRISFTENLARKDLSLWEIAKACAKIKRQKEAKGGMNSGDIDKHIANLIQKDDRTVRRYLKLASLENEPLTKAVHLGDISPSMALDLGRRKLEDYEIESLLEHIKKHPKTTRTFKIFYSNLEMCARMSRLSVFEMLQCPNADKFLSLEKKELLKRIVHRKKGSNKSVPQILNGMAGSLVKYTGAMDAEIARKSFRDQFDNASLSLSESLSNVFKDSEIDAQFKIEPKWKNMVALTISAPIDLIHKVMKLAASKTTKKNVKEISLLLKRKNQKKKQNSSKGNIVQLGKKVVIFNDKPGIALTPQKKIDSHNFPFTLNTGIGCHFGCQYCYLQGSPFRVHTKFPDEAKVKLWMAEKLDRELERYKHLPQHLKRVQVNVATEGYLPLVMTKVKKKLNRDIMAEVLQVFRKHWEMGNHWMVHLITKSHMVLKHLDIISAMRDQVQLEITITTLDEDRRRKMEGWAPSVSKRLKVMEEFASAGVFVRTMCMPLIGDRQDAETIRTACFDSGARAFKHKGVNYWDEQALLNGETAKITGRHDDVFDDLLVKSCEPYIVDGEFQKMTVKMPVIVKSGKSKRWKGYKESDLEDREMTMEVSGYSEINDIDWGYVK